LFSPEKVKSFTAEVIGIDKTGMLLANLFRKEVLKAPE
jgi:hypothetical protein